MGLILIATAIAVAYAAVSPAILSLTDRPLLNLRDGRFVATPEGAVAGGLTWLGHPDEIVVSLFRLEPNPRHFPLFALQNGASAFTPLNLPDDPTCNGIDRKSVQVLPDGRLGFIQDCFGSRVYTAKTLIAYDPQGRVPSPLRPYFLPFHAQTFGFSPDMKRGVLDEGDILFEKLDWLGPDSHEPVTLPLAIAESPAWSPDGRSIALIGAPGDQGRTGVDRLDLPKNLYLMDPNNLQLRILVPSVSEAGSPAWSPDSQWLLVPMRFTQAHIGLWLVKVATGQVYHLLQDDGDFTVVTWSPDGRSFAVAVSVPDDVQRSQHRQNGIYIFRTPSVGQGSGK